jgi:hypothetical protein
MKLVTKLLTGAISLFEKVIVPRIKVEWFSKLVTLLAGRLKAVTEALTDADLNNNAQLEQIAKETLLTPEFQSLQADLFKRAAEKINQPIVTQLFAGTETLRSQLFIAIGDDVTPDADQVKTLLADFVKTEQFDELVIALTTLLAEKYAKNEIIKNFIVMAIEDLVNSDDND